MGRGGPLKSHARKSRYTQRHNHATENAVHRAATEEEEEGRMRCGGGIRQSPKIALLACPTRRGAERADQKAKFITRPFPLRLPPRRRAKAHSRGILAKQKGEILAAALGGLARLPCWLVFPALSSTTSEAAVGAPPVTAPWEVEVPREAVGGGAPPPPVPSLPAAPSASPLPLLLLCMA